MQWHLTITISKIYRETHCVCMSECVCVEKRRIIFVREKLVVDRKEYYEYLRQGIGACFSFSTLAVSNLKSVCLVISIPNSKETKPPSYGHFFPLFRLTWAVLNGELPWKINIFQPFGTFTQRFFVVVVVVIWTETLFHNLASTLHHWYEKYWISTMNEIRKRKKNSSICCKHLIAYLSNVTGFCCNFETYYV